MLKGSWTERLFCCYYSNSICFQARPVLILLLVLVWEAQYHEWHKPVLICAYFWFSPHFPLQTAWCVADCVFRWDFFPLYMRTWISYHFTSWGMSKVTSMQILPTTIPGNCRLLWACLFFTCLLAVITSTFWGREQTVYFKTCKSRMPFT